VTVDGGRPQPVALVAHAAEAGLSRLGGHGRALIGPAVEAVRGRRWGRLWLGPALAVVVAVLALAFRTRTGHAFLMAYAITRPGDPLGTVLLKLPLSMFAPAALLPFWFAVFQVGIVYSVAQALVGATRTVLVAVAGHLVATLFDGVWLWLGSPVGVPPGYRSFGDAGPSVAVVALLAYLAVVRRVGWLALAVGTYDLVELAVFNGLSQRDHLLGAATGALAALGTVLLVRRGPVGWPATRSHRPRLRGLPGETRDGGTRPDGRARLADRPVRGAADPPARGGVPDARLAQRGR
jgi:hypothetical protein